MSAKGLARAEVKLSLGFRFFKIVAVLPVLLFAHEGLAL